MTSKKMGKMTSLSKLSGIKSKSTDTTEAATPEQEVKKSEVTEDKPKETKAKVNKRKKVAEKPVTVNIKISKNQKDWLADTASQVRNNNTKPVPPAQRVYPQHLIGVAIDFLEAAGIDWDEVRNVEELRKQLNL